MRREVLEEKMQNKRWNMYESLPAGGRKDLSPDNIDGAGMERKSSGVPIEVSSSFIDNFNTYQSHHQPISSTQAGCAQSGCRDRTVATAPKYCIHKHGFKFEPA